MSRPLFCAFTAFCLSVTLVLGVSQGAEEQPASPVAQPKRVPLLKEAIPQTEVEATATADKLEREIPEDQRSESVRMLIAIARGSEMAPTDGWFGPANSQFDFGTLVQRWGEPDKGAFSVEDLSDPIDLLSRLDRDKNGRITGDDLDWSDESPWVQQARIANRVFRRLDRQADGTLTIEEWQEFFDKARGNADSVSLEAFRDALISGRSAASAPPSGSPPPSSQSGGTQPTDEPTMEILLKGLAAGEIGSLLEGPRSGEMAPDFTLPSLNGTGMTTLSQLVGEKPTVLIFGNYTCGPFRSSYPLVEPVIDRFRGRVNFLFVYVREAHPCNGWCMASNEFAGVHVEQPTDNAARTTVAKTCMDLLKPTIPVVVDGVDDTVGNQYSAMPARLYVLDKTGRVTYQSGRGPFGFKVGEMEQALVLTLLDEITAPPQPENPIDSSEPAKPAK